MNERLVHGSVIGDIIKMETFVRLTDEMDEDDHLDEEDTMMRKKR